MAFISLPRKLWSAIALSALLAACGGGGGGGSDDSSGSGSGSDSPLRIAGGSPRTGFIEGTLGATPLIASYSGSRAAIQLDNAAQKTVIVFMEGESDPRVADDCHSTYSPLPWSLRQLQGDDTALFFLCSEAINARPEAQYDDDYLQARVAEFEALAAELQAAGVAPDNIYLAGHSTGGWTALAAAARLGRENIGGVIAFAPAFAGEAATRPYGLTQLRENKAREITSGKAVHALVFAYLDDPLENPDSLQFLTDAFPDTVTLVGYACNTGVGHQTAYTDCRLGETVQTLRDYIGQ